MATYNGADIEDLDTTTPDGTAEAPSVVDNAIREIKTVLKNQFAITTTSGNLSAGSTHSVILGNGAHTVTLPDADTVGSSTFTKYYLIQNIHASSTLSIETQSSQTIDGTDYSAGSSLDLTNQYEWILIWTNGSNYFSTRTMSTANPTFSAYLSADQSITSATTVDTKVTFDTENFDTNSDFASNKFTPSVAGKYLITVGIHATSMTTGDYLNVYLFKNGAAYKKVKTTQDFTIDTEVDVEFSVIVSMNGSTDYLEVYVEANDTSYVIEGGATESWFEGTKVSE